MEKNTFVYVIELEAGYIPTMEEETENEIEIKIEIKNRVTADRAIKALLTGTNNKIIATYAER